MTLKMRDRENIEAGRIEGRIEGRKQERLYTIQKMIRKGYKKEDILALDYTEEEYTEARSAM